MVFLHPPTHPLYVVGLKVDADVKHGKTVHVPDGVYKKGCVRDAKHGVAVSRLIKILDSFVRNLVFKKNLVVTLAFISIQPHC